LLPPHLSLEPLSPLNLLTLLQLLGDAHLTSPLRGRPPHHTHPTPSPSDTPTDPIPSTPDSRTPAMPDVGVRHLRLVLVLAIRSTWSWAPPSRLTWFLLLTWAADAPPPPSLPRCTSRGQRHKWQLRPALEVEDLLHGVHVLPLCSLLQRCKGDDVPCLHGAAAAIGNLLENRHELRLPAMSLTCCY
jgi:hypothetical protein